MRFRAAIGHSLAADKKPSWAIPAIPYLSLGGAPFGSLLTMSASDLIIFARAFLNQGLTDQGERWLSEHSVRQMQLPTISLVDNNATAFSHWSLGWGLLDSEDKRSVMLGHHGITVGQSALLHLLPEQHIAFAVQFNTRQSDLLPAILDEMLERVAGVDCLSPTPLGQPIDSARYIGFFESMGGRYQVRVDGEGLVASAQSIILKTAPEPLQYYYDDFNKTKMITIRKNLTSYGLIMNTTIMLS